VSATEEEKRTRTESVSFRIKRTTLDDLRNESKEKIENLNVLVNQIFRCGLVNHFLLPIFSNHYFKNAHLAICISVRGCIVSFI
jgi:hypothetical protein